MALLPILRYPDNRLHKKAERIREVTPEIRQLAADMAETMYEAPGIGLAATQVNVHLRVITDAAALPIAPYHGFVVADDRAQRRAVTPADRE